MPMTFAVTAAGDSLLLDAQGRGRTTFTVTNLSARPQRIRARLVPDDPHRAAWLSLDDDAERELLAGGTHQFTVRLAVPPGAAPGRYTFGLDAVSVRNPDEEWAEGPKVFYETGPLPQPAKRLPVWLVPLLVAVLLVAGLGIWLAGRRGGEADPSVVHVGAAGVLDPCERRADCEEGLVCQSGLCRGLLRFSPCTKDEECSQGLSCFKETCLGAVDTKCAADADCATGICYDAACLTEEMKRTREAEKATQGRG